MRLPQWHHGFITTFSPPHSDDQPACDNDQERRTAAPGPDEGLRSGMMDILVADITI